MKIITDKLIPTWRQAHNYVTVQLAGLLVLVSTAYDYLPAIHEYLPEGYSKYIGIAIIVARIVSQPKIKAKDEQSVSKSD
jgi:hypothetical protein